MGDGYDRVATRPRRPREISNVQDPSELNNQPSNPQSYENEMPQFINNIIFCRDPTILNDRVSCLNLKNLMQHENILDIK